MALVIVVVLLKSMWEYETFVWVRKRNKRKRQGCDTCEACGLLMRDLLKVDDLKAKKMKTKREEVKGVLGRSRA